MRIFILLLLLFTACQSNPNANEVREWMTPNEKVKVLSTTAMIEDLVKRIGGEHVDSLTLIQGELDPHSYQLVKGDDEKLLFAQIIFYNGLGLEHGSSLQYHLGKSPKAVPLGDYVKRDSPESIIYINHQADPHIWMDVSLWARTIPYIVEALSKKDPQHAAEYRANGEKILQEMLEADHEIKELLQAVPESRRYLVTSHDAFNYFARKYMAEPQEINMEQWEKRFQAPEGLAPESQLSTTDIQHIINHVTKYNIHVLFPESNINKNSIRKIVAAGKEKGLQLIIADEVLYSDAMGHPGSDGDSYIKMIQHNARTIAKKLMEPPAS